jgi:predicted MFS family arabinose efflux permease
MFAGMAFTAKGITVLKQIQKYRVTMMSLNSAFVKAGIILATLAGGLSINLYNYQTMALVLGGPGVGWNRYLGGP